MIISKANLQTVHTTKVDKNIPAIDNVHVAEDGSTIGIGGKMMIAVGPVKDEVKKKLKNVLPEKGGGGLTINSDTVKDVIKNIPADKQFYGLREHCNVEKDGDEVLVTMTDGKRKKRTRGKLFPREFLPYKSLVKQAMETSKSGNSVRIVLNLKRFILLLQTIERVAPDTTGENPVWIEFTEKNYIIIRGLNMINGQRCIAIMSPYEGTEGKWLDLDEWELSFLEDEKQVKESKVKHKKKILTKSKSFVGNNVKHKKRKRLTLRRK